jgi:hypothetical protein
MAVSEDVLEIVQILTEEGFGVVAGDLLAEISARSEEGLVFDEDEETGDLKTSSEAPLAKEEQLGEAFRILKLRLIEPARHLAEGERIAASLAGRTAVPIRFVRPDGRERGEATTRAPAGNAEQADRLEDTLWRIAAARPPTRI